MNYQDIMVGEDFFESYLKILQRYEEASKGMLYVSSWGVGAQYC